MPVDMSTRRQIEIVDLDRFRASLKCDLFIPSYVHSLSIATEFIYDYVLSRFPKDFFNVIHIVGKHPFEDFRRLKKGDFVVQENPVMNLSYSIQYDYNDNDNDYNLLSTNKYLRRSQWQRSFFKCPSKGLYIGMDLEAMMIDYTFKFQVNTKAEQLDLYNRLRKVFRLGCTETRDIDCDFHMDRSMIMKIAQEAGYPVDTSSNDVVDPWNFIKFLNSCSQMPILYKLRLINQRYEYFLRMRNLPIHMDFQNSLSADDGSGSGMQNTNYSIEFPISLRFPSPRTFALYNEGKWHSHINVEDNKGIEVVSMKVADIPEVNYKGWPLYGHSNYLASSTEKTVSSIDITELFKAPVDVKINTDLNSIIQDSIDQYISPDVFVEVAVYTNNFVVDGSGRVPISMDWEHRKIILPPNTEDQYYYLAIYIDREYVNNKVIDLTNAKYNRVSESASEKINEIEIRSKYVEDKYIEDMKYNNHIKQTSENNPRKKARFIIHT